MSFQDLLEYFGKKRKKYIKRVILEESLEPEDGPGIIRVNRTAKLKLEHKKFLENLLDDPSYLGGLKDTTERLIYHDDPKIQVNVSESAVRKYLNRDYVMKNLINQGKPTRTSKSLSPTNIYKEKQSQAKKIGLL